MTLAPTGRLAPSPTGAQHLGNARTYLIAWLLNRRSNGKLILRIEDLETPRIKAWATAQAIDDLKWLGLDWDYGPDCPGILPPLMQSQRLDRYQEVLQHLKKAESVYPCICTRSQIESIASAPHESQLDGPVYTGICSVKCVADSLELDRQKIPYSWRFRIGNAALQWIDFFAGEQSSENPATSLGDFIVWRYNNSPAYQLAVVVDDHDTEINQVVRGNDLIHSTFRQIAIYKSLGWEIPQFYHLPLLIGEDGKRLAKRHGDTRLSTFRESGYSTEEIVGYLAWLSWMIEQPAPISAKDLLSIDPLKNLPKESVVASLRPN